MGVDNELQQVRFGTFVPLALFRVLRAGEFTVFSGLAFSPKPDDLIGICAKGSGSDVFTRRKPEEIFHVVSASKIDPKDLQNVEEVSDFFNRNYSLRENRRISVEEIRSMIEKAEEGERPFFRLRIRPEFNV